MDCQADVGFGRCAGEDSREARTMSSSLSPGIGPRSSPNNAILPLCDKVKTTEQYFESGVESNDCECVQMMERKIGVEQTGRIRSGPARCEHTDSLGLMRPRDKCHWC